VIKVVARQGDLLLIQNEDWEKLVKSKLEAAEAENGRLVLLRGEATGHHHSVAAESADLRFFVQEDRLTILNGTVIGVLEVHQETDLVHVGHHSPIAVGLGTYFIVQQREYRRGEVRQVAD
jgi:hypothetical protein